jgi:hypothetical protein
MRNGLLDAKGEVLVEWSLALIGNASGETVGVEWGVEPRRFR